MRTVLDDVLRTCVRLTVMAAPPGEVDTLIIADKAFLLDAETRKTDEETSAVTLYGKDTLKLPSDPKNPRKVAPGGIVWVKSRKELSDVLRKYKKIRYLVIYTHGTPSGSIIFDADMRTTGPALDHDLDRLITPAEMSKGMPEIGEIEITGCTVGKKPVMVLKFARQLKAKKVTAWNYYRGVDNFVIKPDPYSPERVEEISNVLRKYEGYFLEGTPSAEELAKMPGRVIVGLESFRETLDLSELEDADDLRHYKKRSEAKLVTIRNEEDAKAFQATQEPPEGGVVPELGGTTFYRVVVEPAE